MEDKTMDIFLLLIQATGILVTIFIAWKSYDRSFKKWLEQKKIENDYTLQKMQYDSKMAAYKGAWQLISYMGEMDNPKAMFSKHWKNNAPNIYLDPKKVEIL